jgi:hypothetical protein
LRTPDGREISFRRALMILAADGDARSRDEARPQFEKLLGRPVLECIEAEIALQSHVH